MDNNNAIEVAGSPPVLSGLPRARLRLVHSADRMDVDIAAFAQRHAIASLMWSRFLKSTALCRVSVEDDALVCAGAHAKGTSVRLVSTPAGWQVRAAGLEMTHADKDVAIGWFIALAVGEARIAVSHGEPAGVCHALEVRAPGGQWVACFKAGVCTPRASGADTVAMIIRN